AQAADHQHTPPDPGAAWTGAGRRQPDRLDPRGGKLRPPPHHQQAVLQQPPLEEVERPAHDLAQPRHDHGPDHRARHRALDARVPVDAGSIQLDRSVLGLRRVAAAAASGTPTTSPVSTSAGPCTRPAGWPLTHAAASRVEASAPARSAKRLLETSTPAPASTR